MEEEFLTRLISEDDLDESVDTWAEDEEDGDEEEEEDATDDVEEEEEE
jgi:hypothetical protein